MTAAASQLSREEAMATIVAIRRHGGRFARALAFAWQLADDANRLRIEAAFPDVMASVKVPG